MMTFEVPGKCYGVVIEHHDDQIIEYFISEFENQIALFDGFLQSALDLGRVYTGSGYRHLDFGLMKFNLAHRGTVLFLIITNEAISKKIGFQTLTDVINLFRSNYLADNGSIKDSISYDSIAQQFRLMIKQYNHRFKQLFMIKRELEQIIRREGLDTSQLELYSEQIDRILESEELLELSGDEREEYLLRELTRRVRN